MQSITIIGNLGKQAEVRTTQNGRQYLNFSVAVNSKRNNEVKTTWYEVLSFQEQHITKLTQYLRKGTQVVVVGELDPEANIYQDKTGQQKAYLRLIILTDKIEFVSSGNPNAQSTTGATSTVAEQYSKQNDDFNMGMGAKPQPQQSGYAQPTAQPQNQAPQAQPAPQQYQAQPAPQQYQAQPVPQQYQAQPAPQQYQAQPAPQQYQAQPAPQPSKSFSQIDENDLPF